MHDLLQPVAFLLGAWEGEGRGLWGGGFEYRDTWRFSTDVAGGRPLVEFRQQTFGPEGHPSHGECGYLVAQGDGRFHMSVAEPSGITEVLVGDVDARTGELRLTSHEIGHSPSTAAVTAVERRWWIEGEHLMAEVDMAVNGEPLAPHTHSELRAVIPS